MLVENYVELLIEKMKVQQLRNLKLNIRFLLFF